ncbi:hypothetical protein BKA70DRAFT_1260826 [Coprinopsis sp. MPI-PUGE-AT-0042]|nr:hypothetical protein BKA70DRAFT_1260826 [Coprinopsis sp. MPI-PUGE-AT-0042]
MSGTTGLRAAPSLPSEDIAGYVLSAVITCLLWETLINLSFEIDYAIGQPHTMIKVAYFVSRYMGLGIQFTILRYFPQARLPVPSLESCRLRLSIQFLVLGLIMMSLYLVLLTRLWALWDRNKVFGWFLVCFTTVKTSVVGVLLSLVIRKAVMGYQCTLEGLPHIAIIICVIEIIAHLLAFFLTLVKCYLKSGGHFRVVPLLDMMIRDGGLILIVTMFFCAGTIATLVESGKSTQFFPPFAIAAISVTTCRVIKNHRQFRQEDPPPSAFSQDMTILSV